METSTIIIAIIGGFAAGCINTLAGNGSAITLTILTEIIGLPPNIANGTNRVGILMQGWASSSAFIKNGKVDFGRSKWPIIFGVIGALIGVIVAVNVSNDQFKFVFKYMMLIMLGVLLVKPKRWLITYTDTSPLNLWIAGPLFLALGFYGGFIQMGMGVLFLLTTVLVLKYNIIDANALKTLLIAIYTILVVVIFHYNGLIDWKVGLTIALGQATGGYLTS